MGIESENILYLTIKPYDMNTGVGKKIHAQILALQSIFNKVSVCSTAKNNSGVFRLLDGEVLEEYKITKFWFLFAVCSFNKLSEEIKKRKIKYIYIRYFHGANFYFLKFLDSMKKKGVVVIIEVPTFPYDGEYVGRSIKDKLVLMVDQLFRNKIGKLCHLIISFTEHDNIFGVNPYVMPNCVNSLSIVKPIAKSQDEIRFLSIARYNNWHGLERFIYGLHTYYSVTRKKKVVLDVVGDGPALCVYQELVVRLNLTNYVFFHGRHVGNNLDLFLSKSDVGVDSLGRHRSGNNQNNSLKSKEYICNGLPIIMSHVDPSLVGFKYAYKVSSDEAELNIDVILDWYERLGDCFSDVRSYGVVKFSWQKQFEDLFRFLIQVN